jgi:CHAD domain-containing protein
MPLPPLTYAFQPKEEIREGFVRMLGEITKRARALARLSSGPMEEPIHDGRLLIKRLRALLWFVRPALNEDVLSQAKMELKNAAGILGGHRDLAVARATLKKLTKEASTVREREALKQTSRQLGVERGKPEVTDKQLRLSLKKAMAIVGHTGLNLKQNVARDRCWPSARERVDTASRAQIKAAKKAQRSGEDEAFHEWRKKAKRLFYQLELTQSNRGKTMSAAMKTVEKLQAKLGEYHDDVVVEGRLRAAVPPSPSAKCVLKSLGQQKAHLRKKARKIARRVKAKN